MTLRLENGAEMRYGLGEAIALAADVHRGQLDKAGQPYILHPLAVMNRAEEYYLSHSDGWQLEQIKIVAVLHDALEDLETNLNWGRKRLGDRICQNFGSDVSSAIEALTKDTLWIEGLPHRESYDDYLTRVERNWMARIVKIADLSHNLDAFRMPHGKIGDRDYARWDKYHRALVRLVREDESTR